MAGFAVVWRGRRTLADTPRECRRPAGNVAFATRRVMLDVPSAIDGRPCPEDGSQDLHGSCAFDSNAVGRAGNVRVSMSRLRRLAEPTPTRAAPEIIRLSSTLIDMGFWCDACELHAATAVHNAPPPPLCAAQRAPYRQQR